MVREKVWLEVAWTIRREGEGQIQIQLWG